MNLLEIEKNVSYMMIAFNENRESFIYELLRCYGVAKSSITKLQNGNANISKNRGELLWKKRLFFKECENSDVYETFCSVSNNKDILKNGPRFIIVTDYEELIALDTKTLETLNIKISEIINHYTFFLPWAGMEKAVSRIENEADIRAAEKMAKLYDEIKKENNFTSKNEIHALNVFWARILFCFFAEDTGIFEDKLFTNSIKSYTQVDGSDLDDFIEKAFLILNTKERENTPEFLKKFPYVGGTLFNEPHIKLKFNIKSRKSLIESGELKWSEINPDIFGSMIQAVINPDDRSNLGMHYTSVTNIMKVIEPLFLDELYEEFKKNENDAKKLKMLIDRLSKIKIFDPACGSGNFLIIAYKEMRNLEMKIIKQINKIEAPKIYSSASNISLDQFYGIELDDFAHEIAKLSLWLMEHKMEVEFHEEFGSSKPLLPMQEEGQIINANANRIEWTEACEINSHSEVYILGNPPYIGARLQNSDQKNDIEKVFNGVSKSNNLDYIGCWLYKAAKYIKGYNSKCAFVSTNSICQGEQVEILWPKIFELNVSIGFAHTSFKWKNNAKSNAEVICIIIGLQNNNDCSNKKIFTNGIVKNVNNINPYLVSGKNVVISKKKNSISNFPKINFGSMPNDNNNLILSEEEKNKIIKNNSDASKYIKRLIGAKEIIHNQHRWCIWLKDVSEDVIENIMEFKLRVNNVKEYRIESSREATRKLAKYPQLFGEIRQPKGSYIAIPGHSSERREYIPMNLYTKDDIINNSCFALETNEVWLMGVLMSSMHMIWVKTVGGRIKTDYRYSVDICYNTFPFPKITQEKKDIITEYVFEIIEEREKYLGKTLAELYNPETMPLGLKEAHNNLDLVIERCYKSRPFNSDEERLECLFNLYEEMI